MNCEARKERPLLARAEEVQIFLSQDESVFIRKLRRQPDPATVHAQCSPTMARAGVDSLGRDCWGVHWHTPRSGSGHHVDRDEGSPFSCPYGTIGTRLWVRETWTPVDYLADECEREDPVCIGYRADQQAIRYEAGKAHDLDVRHWNWDIVKWNPSTYMPRWASRLTLRVKGVELVHGEGGVWFWRVCVETLDVLTQER